MTVVAIVRTCACAVCVPSFPTANGLAIVSGKVHHDAARQRLVDDLRLRNRSPRTIACYVQAIVRFAKHFQRSPEQIGPEEIRAYQLHLIDQEHASWSRFNQTVCALRFLYGVTLQRPDVVTMIPFGKRPKTLPAVLSRAEVQKIFDALPDTWLAP